MLVSIKSAKLTKTLFDQVQFLSKEDVLEGRFNVLGWCIVKSKTNLNLKYIVFNDGIEGELRKMLFFDFIIGEEDYLELRNPWTTISNQKIHVEASDRRFLGKSGSILLSDLLEKIKREATERGQFFI